MKLIVVTPAGREKYLRLLSHYVLRSPEVAEWQLWDNCRNDSDRAYLRTLAASDRRCSLKQLPGANGDNRAIGSFFQFCDDPDAFIARAVGAGANGSVDKIRDHAAPWGIHRQGGFVDPFGHIWLVGDRSPLSPHPTDGQR